MAAKIAFFADEAIFASEVAYLIGFDLLRTKICVINTFEATSGKKSYQNKKNQNGHQTGSDANFR